MGGPPAEAYGIYAPPAVLEALDFTWFHDGDFVGKTWTPGPDLESTTAGSQLINASSSGSTGLSFRLVQKLSEKVNMRPGDWGSNPLATAVYDAEMQYGSHYCDNVIVKIYMRLPNLPEDVRYLNFTVKRLLAYLDKIDDESNEQHEIRCGYAEGDWEVGEHLTENACSSTPKYFFRFDARDYNPWINGHYMFFIVQERLPGIPLSTIWLWNLRVPKDIELRRRIIIAFKKAYVEARQYGLWHDDETSRNVLWDEISGRCFLIDFETATIEDQDPTERLTWESLNSQYPHPDWVLRQWCIVTYEMDCEMTEASERRQRQLREEHRRLYNEVWAAEGGRPLMVRNADA